MPSLVECRRQGHNVGNRSSGGRKQKRVQSGLIGAGSVFVQSKLNCRSVGAKAWVGMKQGQNSEKPPLPMLPVYPECR